MAAEPSWTTASRAGQLWVETQCLSAGIARFRWAPMRFQLGRRPGSLREILTQASRSLPWIT